MSVTFEKVPEQYKVFLDGKLVGHIKWWSGIEAGWYYHPKGSKTGGEVFPTVTACMESLK